MLLRTGNRGHRFGAMMSSSTPGWLPLARMTDSPACVTSRARPDFVRMPPVTEQALAVAGHRHDIRIDSATVATDWRSRRCAGRRLSRPSTTDNIMSKGA